jgi:hypothetical protein
MAAEVIEGVEHQKHEPERVEQQPDQSVAVPGEMVAALATAALAARGTALRERNRHPNYKFGAQLATARAEVYAAAADIARQHPLAGAARMMLAEASQLAPQVRWVRFIEPDDEKYLQYIRCRAWQWCAWQLDPDMPQVAPNWDQPVPPPKTGQAR